MKNFVANIKYLLKKIKEDDVTAWASMLTLYLMLSLFPLIILTTDLLTRYSLNNPYITKYLITMLPPSVFTTIKSISQDIVSNQSNAIISTTAIIALWAASRGMLAIIHSLNKAYNIKETRSYIKLRLLALFYTVAFILLILLTLLLIVFGNIIFEYITGFITLPSTITPLFDILRRVLTLGFSMMFFLLLYNMSPTINIGITKVLPGAIFSSLGLLGTSSIFSLYIEFSKSLSYLYGSLTGFIVLILWLYITSTLIMIGGEINAVFSLYHSKERLEAIDSDNNI